MVLKWKFFLKKVIIGKVSLRNFFVSPKLGTKSPPMASKTNLMQFFKM